jgi:hypothetical protein
MCKRFRTRHDRPDRCHTRDPLAPSATPQERREIETKKPRGRSEKTSTEMRLRARDWGTQNNVDLTRGISQYSNIGSLGMVAPPCPVRPPLLSLTR